MVYKTTGMRDHRCQNRPQRERGEVHLLASSTSFRTSWESGRRYVTKSGIRVRSKAEKIIADFLTDSGVRFLYEPLLKVRGHRMRPDFYLIDYGIVYEHFGLDSGNYLRGAETKIALYRTAGIRFMYTTLRDETNIEGVIVRELAATTLP